MPIYAYRCHSCGESFERTLSMSQQERERPNCPACGKADVEQEMTPVSVRTTRKS